MVLPEPELCLYFREQLCVGRAVGFSWLPYTWSSPQHLDVRIVSAFPKVSVYYGNWRLTYLLLHLHYWFGFQSTSLSFYYSCLLVYFTNLVVFINCSRWGFQSWFWDMSFDSSPQSPFMLYSSSLCLLQFLLQLLYEAIFTVKEVLLSVWLRWMWSIKVFSSILFRKRNLI